MNHPWPELRAYARGYLAGVEIGSRDQVQAYRSEARAMVALRALGVAPAQAQGILEQARADAALTTPEASSLEVRFLAGEAIRLLILRWIRDRQRREASEVA